MSVGCIQQVCLRVDHTFGSRKPIGRPCRELRCLSPNIEISALLFFRWNGRAAFITFSLSQEHAVFFFRSIDRARMRLPRSRLFATVPFSENVLIGKRIDVGYLSS